MSKRERVEDTEVDVIRSIELVCCRKAVKGECNGVSLTPLERQVVSLRGSIPSNTLLFVGCGYRAKVYGRDSQVVSRRSGIMCIKSQPFEHSSVPYVRVELYIRRLVAMGYQVAFADQESAAVRAAEGVKSGIFQRTVSHLYSRGTLLPGEEILGHRNDSGNTTEVAKQMPCGEEVGEEEDLPSSSTGMTCSWRGVSDMDDGKASELFMCFVGVPVLTAALSNTDSLEVTMVSFVTRRREVFSVTTALALEDIIQRFDIVEVIVVVMESDFTSPTCASYAAANSSFKFAGVRAYLEYLPEKYLRVLQNTLSLHYGPTMEGEEDGHNVTVSGCTRKFQHSLDTAMEEYLRPYKLDKVYRQICLESISGTQLRHCNDVLAGKLPGAGGIADAPVLVLPGSTLRALDVFYSSIGASGSLLSLLDHSLTVHGARRLRSWLAGPLVKMGEIMERQSAVSYFVQGGDAGAIEGLLRECRKLGDVEATLGKLYSQRCGVLEYVRLLGMSRTVYVIAQRICHESALPPLLRRLLCRVTDDPVRGFVARHTAEMDSAATTPVELFTGNGVAVPEPLQEHMEALYKAQNALELELKRIREVLELPGLEYRTIAGTPFVIDVSSNTTSRVPAEWSVLTRTKSNVRYHTPTITQENIALCAAKDRLAAAAMALWQKRQEELCQPDSDLKVLVDVIEAVATMDALRSIAIASSGSGYVAPRLVEFETEREHGEMPVVSILAGRHPVLDKLLPSGYVSCDVQLRAACTWLLTGPNMGGKSALMRMIGCFVVLAQLGSYVPAAAATLPVFTGLYCRMGSSDSILEGSSTFLTEMEETSRILSAPDLLRSLVLMDELGRGTSSYDGMAVAAATLEYLIKVRSTNVFVTHYQYLCEPFTFPSVRTGSSAPENFFQSDSGDHQEQRVECYYMGFRMQPRSAISSSNSVLDCMNLSDGSVDMRVIFTYKPCRGVTPSSFGVEVAKLAGLPAHVIEISRRLSLEEERTQTLRTSLPFIKRLLS